MVFHPVNMNKPIHIGTFRFFRKYRLDYLFFNFTAVVGFGKIDKVSCKFRNVNHPHLIQQSAVRIYKLNELDKTVVYLACIIPHIHSGKNEKFKE